jgi:hypothetical protein
MAMSKNTKLEYTVQQDAKYHINKPECVQFRTSQSKECFRNKDKEIA